MQRSHQEAAVFVEQKIAELGLHLAADSRVAKMCRTNSENVFVRHGDPRYREAFDLL